MIEQSQPQRVAAQSVARELATAGVSHSEVLKELKSLDLHHALTPDEFTQVFQQYKRPFSWWPTIRISKRLIGAFLASGCLVICVASFFTLAEKYDENFMGWSDAENNFGSRVTKDLVYSSLGLIGGLILALKKRSEDDID